MSKPESSPQTSLDDIIHEEAMKLARGIQKPGQTKEQTKLIAQGIAKGITLYKKQQSAKARERDKARKRALKLREAESRTQEDQIAEETAGEDIATGGATVGVLGGVWLLLLAVLHALPLVLGWSVTVAAWMVPGWALGLVALGCGGAAGVCLYRAYQVRFIG